MKMLYSYLLPFVLVSQLRSLQLFKGQSSFYSAYLVYYTSLTSYDSIRHRMYIVCIT